VRSVGTLPKEETLTQSEVQMAGVLKPGERANRSGQYENTRTRKEVTVTKGEPMPPAPKSGDRYKIVDPTKNKSGRK